MRLVHLLGHDDTLLGCLLGKVLGHHLLGLFSPLQHRVVPRTKLSWRFALVRLL